MMIQCWREKKAMCVIGEHTRPIYEIIYMRG